MKNNWQTKKLGEVCDIFDGLWKGKNTPYIEVGVIRNTNFTKEGFLDHSDVANLPVEIKQYEKRKLQFGDIILEKSGGGPKQPVGRVALFDKKEGEYSFSNFTSAIRVLDKNILDFNFLHRFLYFEYVSGKTESMQRRSTGIRNLQLKEYKQIQIPLPSLPEQKRVVKILNEVFEKVTKAKENAGKNLQNAREFFESYLQSIFDNSDWDKKILEEIAEVKGGKRVPKGYKLEMIKTNHPYITVSDFNDNGTIDTSRIRYISEKVFEQIKRYTITSKDLYISIAGTIGKTGIIPEELNGANLTENACKLVFKHDVDVKFVYYFTKTRSFQEQAGLNTRVAAQPKLALERLKTICLRIPFFNEQKCFIGKLDSLSAETKKLEAIYQQKLASLEELKKSVLQKAFGGEL